MKNLKNFVPPAEARALVAQALAKGWMSIRRMTPHETAFVRDKLRTQKYAEQYNERAKNDPVLHAKKLEYQRNRRIRLKQ